jgi:hypothetical protein
MRQLRTCDFCGDDAAGIYEVLPAELSPTEAEQRRVVLCDDCFGTLETVVSPLLARLGIEETGGETAAERRSASPEPVPAASESDEREGGERRERPLDPAATDRSTDETPATADGDVGDAYVDAETLAGEDAEPATTADEDAEPAEAAAEDYEVEDAAADAEEPPRAHADAADAPAGSDAPDGDGSADDADAEVDEEEPNADYEVDDPDRKQDAEDPAEDYEVTEDEADEGGDDDGAEAVGAEPPNFRKVMRLLNNREFPVDRAEITDIASGAYDLDRSQVDDIIDHAVQRDVLAEDGGQLRKA